MKKWSFLLLATMVLVAGAQARLSTGQQTQPQNVPITPASGQRTRYPQPGEDIGQPVQGVPVAGETQSTAENTFPANTPILATLSKTIEAKKAKEGEPVTAKVEQDVLYQGNVILPRGSRLVGHVTAARPRKKGEVSELGIAWDNALLRSGQEVPMHAIIQALAPPPQLSPADSPFGATSGGMAGTPAGEYPGEQPGMGRPGMGQPPMGEPGNPRGSSSPSTGTTGSGGRLTGPMLSAASRGVQGMPGVALNSPANVAQGTLVTSEKDNVKLNSGTQLVLRIVNQ